MRKHESSLASSIKYSSEPNTITSKLETLKFE